MALTLQQRVNLAKSRPFTATDATFIEKIEQCIRVVAQDCLDETITTSHADLVGYVITDSQLKEWALRALRGNFDIMMLPMIMDRPVLGADPTIATDGNMKIAVTRSLGPYVVMIGSGLL